MSDRSTLPPQPHIEPSPKPKKGANPFPILDELSPAEREYGENGGKCERSPADKGCFLDANQRGRFVGEFRSDLLRAMQNYNTALGNARVEALLQKRSGWGGVGDILYAGLSATLLFGIEALAVRVGMQLGSYLAEQGRIAESEVATYADTATSKVSSIVRTVTSTARGSLRALFAGLPAEAAQKAAFVTVLQTDVNTMFANYRDQILLGTDADLMLGLATFSARRATVDFFAESIERLFSRYQALWLEDVGKYSRHDVKYGGSREVVWLTAFGKSRLAMVAFHENGVEIDKHEGYRGYENRSYFLTWVDPEFEYAAIDAQAKGIGAVKEIDVSTPAMYERYIFEDPTLEVEQWAHRMKTRRQP